MDPSETVRRLQQLCDKFATEGSNTGAGELSELARLLGSVVASQHREIERLQAHVAKLGDQLPGREANEGAAVIEASGFILKDAVGKTLAELATNDTGSQLLLYGADGKRKALLSTTLAAGFANVPRLDLFDHHERLRVRLGVHEPLDDTAGTNPHGPPQLIFFEESGERVTPRQNEMWFFGEDSAEVAAVQLMMVSEGLKLTAFNQDAGVVYSAIIGKAAPH